MSHWRITKDGKNYSISINSHLIEFTMDENSPETFGAKSMLAKRFLQNDKWQQHIKNIFGASIFDEVWSAAEIAATLEHPNLKKFADGTACPYCGKPLRTERAKICPHCFKSWHNVV